MEFTGTGKNNATYVLKAEVWEKSSSSSSNSSVVGYRLTLESTGSYSFVEWGSNITFNVDGEVYNYWTQRGVNAYSSIEICSGEKTIQHNSDGTKTISISASYREGQTAYYTPGDIDLSGTLKLTDIALHPVITLSEVSKSASTIKVKATASGISATKYRFRIGSGVWNETTDNTFEFSDLSANTQYSISCQGYGNNGWGVTATKDIKTSSKSEISDIGDFTLNGCEMTLNGGGNIVVLVDGVEVARRDNVSSGKYTLVLTSTEKEAIYKKSGTDSQIQVVLRLESGGSYNDYPKSITISGDVFSCIVNLNGVIKKGKVWIGTNAGNKQGIFVVGTSQGNKRGGI